MRTRSSASRSGAPAGSLLLAATILLLGAPLGSRLLARTPPRPQQQQQQQQQQKQQPATPNQQVVTPDAGQIPTIVSNVELVNVLASVQDKHGGYVTGLKQSDFRILEDGRPQQIRFFSSDTSVPITLGLLLDTSPSQTNVLDDEQQVSDSFFRQVLTPKDLAFLINFDVDITLLQDLTSSPQKLINQIDQTHIGGGGLAGGPVTPGPFPTSGSGGATHLWDAIYLACDQVLSQQVGRKALLVVTDGDDEGSSYTPDDALRAALDANTVVFAIIDADPRFYGSFGMGYSGASRLEHLAEETGGRGFPARHKDLQKTFDTVNQQLRTQYSIAYRSDRPERDGTFRTIKVELTAPENKDDKVRARSGYYATPIKTAQ